MTVVVSALGALSAAAQAFNPVPLTPGSFTRDIVVETNYGNSLAASNVFFGGSDINYHVTASQGGGTGLGDFTFYEQGLRIGTPFGMPPHGTTITHKSKAGIQYVMPPDYTTNNCMFIDNGVTSGTLTFNSPTTATNLSFFGTSGGGAGTILYQVVHADASTETGSITFADWFNGANYAWTNSGRITVGGGYGSTGDSAGNPRVYSSEITVSDASPVVSVDFAYSSGGRVGIYAISGNAAGASWTPIPVGGFNHKVIVPVTPLPYPVTATMDQGTNLAFNANLATWFEKDLAGPSFPDAGLPHPGSLLTNVNFPSHVYQMAASYTGNNSILIDTNNQTANITPITPTSYTAIALLTAGANISGAMTNMIIIQHANGVAETNLFFGYDWFANNSQIAYVSGGRINLASRSFNNLANPVTLSNNPKLFESTFGLVDTASPVTNIVLKYLSGSSASSTTYVMAVSASAGAVGPAISAQSPSATVFQGSNVTFSVTISAGTPPLTYTWQTNGVTLVDGGKVSGATTNAISLANVDFTEAGAYQLIIANGVGAITSSPIVLTVLSSNLDITLPGDPLVAYQPSGATSPGAEGPTMSIDNTTTKYLNTGANNGTPFVGPVGFVVTPLQGSSKVTGLRFYTANDATERDPADYTLEGSTDGSNFVTIASGSLSLPTGRNGAGQPLAPLTMTLQEVNFVNTTPYTTYRVSFSTVRDSVTANSMQIGEVELLGTLNGTGPAIIQGPSPSFSLNFEGLISTLTVSASGTPTLTYQWKQNGVDVPGATNAAFSFVTLPATNTYSVIVANAFTPPATSSVATVVGVTSTLATTFVVNFHDAMAAQYAENVAGGDLNLWTNVTYTGLGAYPDVAGNTNWNGFGNANGYAPVFNSTVSPQVAADGSPIPVTLTTTYNFDSGGLFFYGDGSPGNTCSSCPSLVLGYNAVAASGNPPGTFTLHSVPPGSYTLYVYCANSDNDRGSLFTINGGSQASCTNASNGAPASAFVEGVTYVSFTNITPNADGTIIGSYTGITNPVSGLSGEGNFNGLQLIKVATSVPTLSISRSGGNVSISWTPGVGVLQSAPAITGPYTDIPASTSPYSAPATGAPKYYRVRL